MRTIGRSAQSPRSRPRGRGRGGRPVPVQGPPDSVFRELVDCLPHLAWIAEPDGARVWFNRTWLDYTGATLDEARGFGWARFHDPAKTDEIVEKYRRAVREGRPWEATLTLRRKDGAYRWFLSHAVPVPDERGRVVRWFGTNTDVTELRQARAELEKTAEQMETALRAGDLGTWDYDFPSRALHLGERTCGFFGLEGEAVDADAVLGRIHPDDRGALREAIRALVAEGENRFYEGEFRVLRPDGQIRWLAARGEIHFSDSRPPRPTRFIGTVTDITDRRRSEQRLRRMYDSGMVGVIYWATDGKILDANDKFLQMTGYDREDLAAGRLRWPEMTPPEYRPLDERALAELRATGVDTPYEKEYLRKDGSRVPIVIGAAMLDRTFREGVAFVLDVADRKRAEEAMRRALDRLAAADRSKDEFLAMLAHELRNPLSVLSNLHQLLEQRGPDPRTSGIAETMERQVGILTRLVDDLMDVSRIERGRIEVRRRTVNVASVLRDVVRSQRDAAHRQGLLLRLRVPARPVLVFADPMRLAQMAGNLVQNALKFTPEGGHIDVTLGVEDRTAVFRVEDSGKGIAADLLPHIFDLFTQGEPPPDRGQGGLGLGLTLVKALTELHGGTVRAESGGPGRGSAFTIRLPVQEGEEAEPEESPAERAAPGRLPAMRLLLVEDNADVANAMAQVLALLDQDVKIAADGRSGLKEIAEWSPVAAFVDIGLPDMDGYELARRVREREGRRRLFLIALTGYGRDEDRERSREAGFDLHLVKPVGVADLKKALETVAVRQAGRSGAGARRDRA